MRPLALIGIICFCICGPVSAQETGIGLFQDCVGSQKNKVSELTCQTYFNGFSEAYLALAGLNAYGIGVCLPSGITPNQIILVTEKYMSEHPERLHMLASRVIIDALRQSFPCKKSN